jgi:hypothetical protein
MVHRCSGWRVRNQSGAVRIHDRRCTRSGPAPAADSGNDDQCRVLQRPDALFARRGPAVFEFIRNFVADGRLIRLGGPFNARAIPLLREHLPVDYDLVIDEPAKSPNAKEVFWEKMAPIIPMLIKANAFLPEILDYSPFPASIAAKLKQQLASRTAMPAPGPPPNPGKDPREVQASVAQKSAAAELALARARDIDSQSRMRKLALALAAVRAGARADLPQPLA